MLFGFSIIISSKVCVLGIKLIFIIPSEKISFVTSISIVSKLICVNFNTSEIVA